jgi:hypothetical protein
VFSQQPFVVVAFHPNLILHPESLANIALAEQLVALKFGTGDAKSFTRTDALRFQPSKRLQEPELACFLCKLARANTF